MVYILFDLENIVMFKICMEAVDNKSLPLLKQIMLKFPHFLELYHYLSEQDFTLLLTYLEYYIVGKHESLVLQSDQLYLFVGTGVMLHQQTIGRTQKNIRIHENNQGWRSKTCNRGEIKQTHSYEIRQFDSYEDVTNNNYRQSQNTFYNSSMQTAIVLFIDPVLIEGRISSKLQSIYIEKLKSLHETNFFHFDERHLIQGHLHRFRFMVLKFNQFLYSRNNRENVAFFIKKGALQIMECRQKKQMDVRRVYGRCALSYERKNEESAKCISSLLHCYAIDKITMESILSKKNSNISRRNTTGQYSQVRAPSILVGGGGGGQQTDRRLASEESSHLVEMFNKTGSLAIIKRRKGNYTSLASSRVDVSMKKRRDKLRQHFSNFYNQAYENFSSLKIKQLGLKMQDKQNLVLYKIKILQRKAPDMQGIKQKLKKIKFEKMRKCIEELGNQRHIENYE